MAQKSYDKALYRLISILAILAKDERPTVQELAEEFNVSIRTIQTDLYTRLGKFDITKDTFGRLMFKEGSTLLGNLVIE
jgi:DeoR/GlpR family transcriptional regulator of sugar metabolism